MAQGYRIWLAATDLFAVMPVLVTGIHAFLCRRAGVDGRNKSGHDA